MELSHSRMPFLRAYFRETQELVFDAHDKAFAFFGGVCRRGIYDNMKTAVGAIFVGTARRLLVSQITAPAARAVRSPRLNRHLPMDHWVVTHLLHGATLIETPRGTVEIQARQSYIWSPGEISSSKRSKIDRVDLLL